MSEVHLPERVLVPLDGTPESARALPVARRVAEIAHASLHILHVSERPLDAEALRRELSLSEAQLADAVLEGMVGEPASGIARAAAACPSLVVMARYAAHASPTGLGSIAEGVLRCCASPLLLVTPHPRLETWRLRRVLLPQDGSPASAAAVAPAVALTQRAGADLSVIHVSDIGREAPSEPGAMGMPHYIDQPQHEWPAWSREFLERMEALCRGLGKVHFHLYLARGEPGAEIVRTVREHDIDLVVLAWHGKLDPEHARVLKTVIRDAPCPILILPFSGGQTSEGGSDQV